MQQEEKKSFLSFYYDRPVSDLIAHLTFDTLENSLDGKDKKLNIFNIRHK